MIFKSQIFGFILLHMSTLCVMQIQCHPTYNNQNVDNRVLTEYSDDVVSTKCLKVK